MDLHLYQRDLAEIVGVDPREYGSLCEISQGGCAEGNQLGDGKNSAYKEPCVPGKGIFAELKFG